MLPARVNAALDRLLRTVGLDDVTIRTLRMRATVLFLVPRYRYVKNLRLLNDALSGTTFADHYWVSFGLLLGWARRGRPIPWDFRDADFSFLARDRTLFLNEALPALLAAGFEPGGGRRNNAGLMTDYAFYKDRAKFEFFEMYEDDNELVYYSYGRDHDSWYQVPCRLPKHGTERFQYLRRAWLKPDNHEEYLTSAYGNWRVPQPVFDSLGMGAVEAETETCHTSPVSPL